MKRTAKFVHLFAILYAPIAFVTLFDGGLWLSFLPHGVIGVDPASTVLVFLLLAWLLAAWATIARLAFDRAFREAVMIRLAGLRERDEREEMIVGGAARASFFTTVAATVALLFLAPFTYIDYHDPAETGFAFVVETGKVALLNNAYTNAGSTSYAALPLTKFGLLLLLLVVQLASFALFSRSKRPRP